MFGRFQDSLEEEQGPGSSDWTIDIPWTALDFRHIHSVEDLRLHLSMMAVSQIRATQQSLGLSAAGIQPVDNDGHQPGGRSTSQSTDAGSDDLWSPGLVRVFLSHLALHRQFAAEVSRELRLHDIDAFVAHEHIVVTHEWQAEIERALASAELFVGLVHPDSSASYWIQQEIGWALGRELPMFLIRLGEDPHGFPGKIQWRAMVDSTQSEVASVIAEWVHGVPGIGE